MTYKYISKGFLEIKEYIEEETLRETEKAIFAAIKNTLPEEACLVDIIIIILEKCKEDIGAKRIIL